MPKQKERTKPPPTVSSKLGPVGWEWEKLPPLKVSREVVASLFGIPLQGHGEKYFVYAAGGRFREPWPIGLDAQAQTYFEELPGLKTLFSAEGDNELPEWKELADRLPGDPDFRQYVEKSAKNWLAYIRELTLEQVSIAFAMEGHACTVEFGEVWYAKRSKFKGVRHKTWIKQIEGKLQQKPVIRLVKDLAGIPQGTGEVRDGVRQQDHFVTITDHTRGDDIAGKAILDGKIDVSEEPIDIRIRSEQVDSVQEALNNLDSDMRQIVVMRFVDDRTFDDIAAELGFPKGTVRRKLSAALVKLGIIFEQKYTEGNP